jgi:hypothetical protein
LTVSIGSRPNWGYIWGYRRLRVRSYDASNRQNHPKR